MVNQRPFSYEQSRLGPARWRSHFRGMQGLGQTNIYDSGQLVYSDDLQPNDPVLQVVSTDSTIGSPGGSFNAPTAADYAAGAGAYMPTGSYLNAIVTGKAPLSSLLTTSTTAPFIWIGLVTLLLIVLPKGKR